MSTTCSSFGWASATDAIHSFFQEATTHVEEEEEKHQRTLRRNLSLNSRQKFGKGGSFDTAIASDGGILGDRTIWDFYFDADQTQTHHQKTTYAKVDKVVASTESKDGGGSKTSRNSDIPDELCGVGLDHCFVVSSDDDETASKKRGVVWQRRRRKKNQKKKDKSPPSSPNRINKSAASRHDHQDRVPSRDSSSVSSCKPDRDELRRQKNGPPPFLVLYMPRKQIQEEQHLDVVWQRECLAIKTRLVRWSGNLEMSNPNPAHKLQRSHNGSSLTDNTSSSFSQTTPPSMIDSEIGWITCYNISRGLTELACAASVDPVLVHFCKRFGLWQSRLDTFQGDVPDVLEQESLFCPYGSQAAEDELHRRLAAGQAPDGAVLEIAAVLQGMPIFFISDLFIDPEYRGTGLGLVLLDRATRRVADSLCLVVVFLRDYTDERLPMYLGLLGFSFLAPGFLMRRHGHGERRPRLDEVCPFLPSHLVNTSGGRL